MLVALITNDHHRDELLAAISTIPTIHAKAEWALRWIADQARPFGERVIAFAVFEGVFFSSAFAAIFWLRSRGMMPGLCHANELIARDEGMHTSFACLLLRHLNTPPLPTVAHAIVGEAVHLELAFFTGMLTHTLRPITPLTNTQTRFPNDWTA